jgi:NADPH-dependent F420 reductase
MTVIGFIGGTGPEGIGLAIRFCRAGDRVLLGSRSEERANEAVAKVKEEVPEADVYGVPNFQAAEESEVVFLAVPFEAHRSTLVELEESIGEKILIDVVVPMEFGEDGAHLIPIEEGSAAQQARTLVPRAKVVSGFQHFDAALLKRSAKPLQGDVIICADHKGAKKTAMDLAEKLEYVRALDGGGLNNARYLEACSVLLVNLNRIHKARSSLRIVGI